MSEEHSTEIALDRTLDHVLRADLVSGAIPTPVVPRTVEEIWRFAQAVLLSGIAPDSYTKNRGTPYPEKVQVARVVMGIQKGLEVGFPPLTALSTIGIINNIPCVYGDGISALIQNKGHLEWMKIEEIGEAPDAVTETGRFSDDFGIRVTMKRRGQDQPYIGEFTVGDAKRARLWMNANRVPWIQHPKRMLKWRAFHRPANDGFADDLMGLQIREIVEDMPPTDPIKTDTSFLDDTPQITEGASDPLDSSDDGSTSTAEEQVSSDTPPATGEMEVIDLRNDLVGGTDWEGYVDTLIVKLLRLPSLSKCNTFAATNRETIEKIPEPHFQRWFEALTSYTAELDAKGSR